jgi:hypothetical protein
MTKKPIKTRSASRLGWFRSPIFRMILSVFWCGMLFFVFAGRFQQLPRGWELVVGFACFAAAIAILWQTLRGMFYLASTDKYDTYNVPQRLDQGHAPDADVAYYDDEPIFQEAERADYQRSRSL